MSQCIQIQWTCATVEEAKEIARVLVIKKLVACANIFPQIESIYLWEGKLETSKEVKVYFKTLDAKFSEVRAYILEHCSYEVPEISKLVFDDGNPAYFAWIRESLL